MTATAHDPGLLTEYLAEVKALVLVEIEQQLAGATDVAGLYELMMNYPLRGGKGLRPALAVATCRGLGGTLDAIIPTAAILELYHNAFLIHDDVEDESLDRRGEPTLHRDHGVPIAVNVGDAMLCLSLRPLPDNTERIGLGPALDVLDVIATMTQRSVEGQATELRWVRHNVWELTTDDYVEMVIAKTGWYSFIAPLQVGALAAHASHQVLDELDGFGRDLAVAFQITDDLLNLDASAADYGKELAGDLWEGKRTLPLLHAIQSASADDRTDALEILSRPRPGGPLDVVRSRLDGLVADDRVDRAAAAELHAALGAAPRAKDADDVAFLAELIDRHDSVEHATAVAEEHVQRASQQLSGFDWLPPSRHRALLEALVYYVRQRRT